MFMSEKRTASGRNLREPAGKFAHEQHFYVRMLKQHFRPGMRWLDAGCGHSLIPKWLRSALEKEPRCLKEAEMIVVPMELGTIRINEL
jgi:hypothetical protein